MIAFTCPQCKSQLQVGDELGGGQARCPNCQAAVIVPGIGIPIAAQGSPWQAIDDGREAAPRWRQKQPSAFDTGFGIGCGIIAAIIGFCVFVPLFFAILGAVLEALSNR
jgi:hypothetical protein